MASWWLTLEDLHWPDYDVEARIERRAAQMAAGGVFPADAFGKPRDPLDHFHAGEPDQRLARKTA